MNINQKHYYFPCRTVGRSTSQQSSLDNRLCIVEWNKSAFGGVESLNKILRQSEFCIANCIGMNINQKHYYFPCRTVGRSTSQQSSLDNRLCIVEWNKSTFGGVESLNKILRQSEFCIANCIGMNINQKHYYFPCRTVGRSTSQQSSLDNRLCIVEWNKSAFGGVESLNKILRQSEFCIANCIGMNINQKHYYS